MDMTMDFLLRRMIVSLKEASAIRYEKQRLQVFELIEFEKQEAELISELLEKLKKLSLNR